MSLASAVPVHADSAPFRLHVVPERSEARRVSRDDIRLLAVIATGAQITSVAGRLDISDRTVRRRVSAICEAINVKTMIEAVAWAARRGLI